MEMNEAYEQEVRRTAAHVEDVERQFTLAALGLTGEAGEVADCIKKWVFQGHPLGVAHLMDELGDVLWYVTLLVLVMDWTLDEVMTRNIEKLRQRYPDGFDTARSLYRE